MNAQYWPHILPLASRHDAGLYSQWLLHPPVVSTLHWVHAHCGFCLILLFALLFTGVGSVCQNSSSRGGWGGVFGSCLDLIGNEADSGAWGAWLHSHAGGLAPSSNLALLSLLAKLLCDWGALAWLSGPKVTNACCGGLMSTPLASLSRHPTLRQPRVTAEVSLPECPSALFPQSCPLGPTAGTCLSSLLGAEWEQKRGLSAVFRGADWETLPYRHGNGTLAPSSQ